MKLRGTATPRGRHLLRVVFVLLMMFTAGLVTSGVVAGAGPLAVLSDSDSTPTGTTTEQTTTWTDPTTESTTVDESTTSDETTTESTTTETEATTTESTPPSGPPTIASDLPDYAPGSTVTLRGTNWAAGEAVHIFVNDSVGQTWSYNADIAADAGGGFTHQFQLPASFVAVYSVTATGVVSGIATTSFTDASTLIAAAPSGVSFTLTYQGFTNSTCTTAASGTPGTIRTQTVTAGSNFDPNANPSFWKLTAGSASAPSGASFSAWSATGGGSFTTITTPNVICAASAGGSTNFIYTATYTTLQATSLTVASANGTYGGTANLVATLAAGGSGVGGKTVTFTLNGSPAGSATTNASGVATLSGVSLNGINAGTFSPGTNSGVAAAFAGDSAFSGSTGSNTLTVGQASSTTTVTCPSNVPYSGSARTPCSVTVTGAGGLSLTPTPSYSNNTNAGTATASYSFAGDTNHTGSSDSTNFMIDKRNVTASITAADKTYDGTDAASISGCTLEAQTGNHGVISGDAVGCSGSNGHFANANAGTGKTVTADVALTGTAAGNYQLSSASASTTANITPKTLTVSFQALDKVWDGYATATIKSVPAASLVGVVSGDDVTLGTSGATATFVNANVGANKTVTGVGFTKSGTDAGNYVFGSPKARRRRASWHGTLWVTASISP